MKEELEKKKKVQSLKNIAKSVSTAKLPEMASKTVKKVGEAAKEGLSEISKARTGNLSGRMKDIASKFKKK